MNLSNIRKVQHKQFIKINWDSQVVCASEQMYPGNTRWLSGETTSLSGLPNLAPHYQRQYQAILSIIKSGPEGKFILLAPIISLCR